MADFCAHLGANAAGLIKLVRFCEIAFQKKYKYAWMDTCCIDKSRSAELEESIRSMYRWYSTSKTCIVHLADTGIDQGWRHLWDDAWFTRGWTLQELLAPRTVEFFDQDWRPITDTARCLESYNEQPLSLWQGISRATGIDISMLRNFKPGMQHIRQIMVWASKRRTTRIEDVAYSLIGMLNVPLSIAYGEGSMAFYRLQLEIVQRTHDKGIFAWQGERSEYSSMFAASPKCFSPAHFHSLPFVPQNDVDPTHSFTNYGMRMPLSLYEVVVESENYEDEHKEDGEEHEGQVDKDDRGEASEKQGNNYEKHSGEATKANSDKGSELNSGEESEVSSDEESEADIKESHSEGPISYVLKVPALGSLTISVVSGDVLGKYASLVIAILGNGRPSRRKSTRSLALLLGYRPRHNQYTRVVTEEIIWVEHRQEWSPPKIVYIE